MARVQSLNEGLEMSGHGQRRVLYEELPAMGQGAFNPHSRSHHDFITSPGPLLSESDFP